MSGQRSGEEGVLDLVSAIYDAALDASLWPGVLDVIGDAIGGPQVMFGIFDPATGLSNMLAPRIDPDEIRDLVAWAPRNPLLPLGIGQAPGKIFTCGDFLALETFTATDFYNEWWRPNGFDTEPLTTNLLAHGDATGILTSYRPLDRPPFDDGQKRMFTAFAKHLVRAAAMQRRLYHLTFANESALAGLDQLQQGFVLVDAEARPLFLNRRAQTLLAKGDALRLEARALSAMHADDGRALRALIASCTSAGHLTAGGEIRLRRAASGLPLEVLVAPAGPSNADTMPWMVGRRAAAMILITDPQGEIRGRIDVLRERFGLTPAEAAFALEIAKGDGRKASAERLGITVGTARSHLSSIFDKTGARRQAELVRLLAVK
jgi:DNA-binding CsgD family transcriptional regulator/PAS domain-containing protein